MQKCARTKFSIAWRIWTLIASMLILVYFLSKVQRKKWKQISQKNGEVYPQSALSSAVALTPPLVIPRFCSSIRVVPGKHLIYFIENAIISKKGIFLNCCKMNRGRICNHTVPIYNEYGVRSFQFSDYKQIPRSHLLSFKKKDKVFVPVLSSLFGWHFLLGCFSAFQTLREPIIQRYGLNKILFVGGGGAPSWLLHDIISRVFYPSNSLELENWHMKDLESHYFINQIILGSKVFSLQKRNAAKTYRQMKALSIPKGISLPKFGIFYSSKKVFMTFKQRFCPLETVYEHNIFVHKVLIIQRRKTRKLLQLDMLIGQLKSKGMECTTVYLEDISLKESLELFQRHRIVIGVHGNGLTHSLCMQRPALLIILVPEVRNPQERKEVPGYNTNNVNEKYAMGYGALAQMFEISSLVIETIAKEPLRGHWQSNDAWINQTIAVMIVSVCEDFLKPGASTLRG